MKETIYLDNAATTNLDPEVVEEMLPYMREHYGNPSSIHSFGRKSRAAIEQARKRVASCLNASTGEIFFTSCGTESNNTAIRRAVTDLGVRTIVSSPIEHHCVLHTLAYLQKHSEVEVLSVELDSHGRVNYSHLEKLLSAAKHKSMVSLMHANNEIGTMIDIEQVSDICRENGAYFHSDTVQTMAHYPFDLSSLHIHFLSGSGHKFHGPKGCGFLYINNDIKIDPLIFGGGQERNMRAGTENLYGIVGLGKAMEVEYAHFESHKAQVKGLRDRMANHLKSIPGIRSNGDLENGLYTILSSAFPSTGKNELLLFNLDIAGVAASGGSACTSGATQASHVLSALGLPDDEVTIRFSFSRFNTVEEVDKAAALVKELCG